MTALEEPPRHATALLVVAMVLVAIIGVPLGFYGSIFGPYYPMAIGAVLAIVGVVGSLLVGRWVRVLLVFGIAVMVGASVYIAIGLFGPEDAGSGSGTVCATGEPCE